MKVLLYLLTLFILTVSTANGQAMNGKIQKLVENELVEKKQIKDFEELLKRNENKSSSAYLYSLFQTEFKKLTGHYYSEIATQINFGNEKPKVVQQKNINEELHLYLSKLRDCDLVTTKQFNDQSKKIDMNEYVHILQLLPNLADQSAYEEWLSADKLIKYGKNFWSIMLFLENHLTNLRVILMRKK